jgi:hypothetical protein
LPLALEGGLGVLHARVLVVLGFLLHALSRV